MGPEATVPTSGMVVSGPRCFHHQLLPFSAWIIEYNWNAQSYHWTVGGLVLSFPSFVRVLVLGRIENFYLGVYLVCMEVCWYAKLGEKFVHHGGEIY